jgi:3D (Asp-Asp-Asp) domain-containing protein
MNCSGQGTTVFFKCFQLQFAAVSTRSRGRCAKTHVYTMENGPRRALDDIDSAQAVEHTVQPPMTARCLALVVTSLCCACATTGSGWIAEAWDPSHPTPDDDESNLSIPSRQPRAGITRSLASRALSSSSVGSGESQFAGAEVTPDESAPKLPERSLAPSAKKPLEGKILGTFRNTYYDFPSESDYSGEPTPLYDAQCKSKISVPKGFFESLCVQGSGLLASGSPVSFNRRDCSCAPVCPRTLQKICFDVLDMAKFPWGRGATGQAITPLLTVAVDSTVVPLGTSLYIPEFDGLPRDAERRAKHDGCFVAQDRGLRVQGKHIDIFTGQAAMTRLWNGLVPSNSGVTVVLNSPHCDRAP